MKCKVFRIDVLGEAQEVAEYDYDIITHGFDEEGDYFKIRGKDYEATFYLSGSSGNFTYLRIY